MALRCPQLLTISMVKEEHLQDRNTSFKTERKHIHSLKTNISPRTGCLEDRNFPLTWSLFRGHCCFFVSSPKRRPGKPVRSQSKDHSYIEASRSSCQGLATVHTARSRYGQGLSKIQCFDNPIPQGCQSEMTKQKIVFFFSIYECFRK